MNKIVNKVLIGASIAVSLGAIASAPAQAGSLTNATLDGTAASDYFVYDVQGNNTVKVQSNQANVNKVLDGNAANPTGNVELRASSEQANFDFSKNTSLSGTIGGKNITLSSLTESDWNSSVGELTFAQKWFNDALTANGFGSLVDTSSLTGFTKVAAQTAYNAALSKFNNGGRERFSDPNISYVNQNDNTGEIKIGLAGHFDATPLLFAGLSLNEIAIANQFRSKTGSMQASEIVKVSYDNGPAQLLYSFAATGTGLTALDDGRSHSGNYEVTLAGQIPTAVPEPSVMLGLLGVAGVFKVQRQRKKAQA
jgi:hypothetical protein